MNLNTFLLSVIKFDQKIIGVIKRSIRVTNKLELNLLPLKLITDVIYAETFRN